MKRLGLIIVLRHSLIVVSGAKVSPIMILQPDGPIVGGGGGGTSGSSTCPGETT